MFVQGYIRFVSSSSRYIEVEEADGRSKNTLHILLLHPNYIIYYQERNYNMPTGMATFLHIISIPLTFSPLIAAR